MQYNLLQSYSPSPFSLYERVVNAILLKRVSLRLDWESVAASPYHYHSLLITSLLSVKLMIVDCKSSASQGENMCVVFYI